MIPQVPNASPQAGGAAAQGGTQLIAQVPDAAAGGLPAQGQPPQGPPPAAMPYGGTPGYAAAPQPAPMPYPQVPPPGYGAPGGDPAAQLAASERGGGRRASRAGWVVAGVALGLVLLGGGAAAYFLKRPAPTPAPVSVQGAASAPTLAYRLLTEQELEANPSSATTVDAQGVAKVTLPAGTLSARTKLRVSEVTGLEAPPDSRLGTTVDVTLGEQHHFDEPITLEIPYDPARVSAPTGRAPALAALSYDPQTKAWDAVPFTVDAAHHRLLVSTNHLSIFSYVSPMPIAVKPMAKIPFTTFPYAVSFAEASTAENIMRGSAAEAAEEGWKASMEWFGIGQAAGTMGSQAASLWELGNVAAAIDRVGELAGNLGLAFSLVQFGLDMNKPNEEVKAVGGALKAIGMDAISRWGTSAMQVAGVGIFIIDYSLGKFADTAWSQRRDMWQKAFACYYKENPRSDRQWLMSFKLMASNAKSPEELQAAISAEVDKRSQEFWQSEEEQGLCQADIGAAWKGAGGGLNKHDKDAISESYKRQLFADLQPVFQELGKWSLQKQQQKTFALLEDLRGQFNTETRIEITLTSKDPNRSLEGFDVAIPTSREPELWRGKTDKNGQFVMRVTTLGYLLYGAPKEIVVTLPAVNGATPETRNKKFSYKRGLTKVEIPLDGAAGTFDGELSGSHSGMGIDGVVQMRGPIHISVDDSGSVEANFTMPLHFTSGHGQSTVDTTSQGKLTGKLEGNDLRADGTVTNNAKTTVKLPVGAPIVRTVSNTAPVHIKGTLVSPDRIEGKLTGGAGAQEVPFSATRR